MNVHDLWEEICKHNPTLLKSENISMPTAKVKKLVYYVWAKTEKEFQKTNNVFEQMFGGRK